MITTFFYINNFKLLEVGLSRLKVVPCLLRMLTAGRHGLFSDDIGISFNTFLNQFSHVCRYNFLTQMFPLGLLIEVRFAQLLAEAKPER